MDGSKYKLTFSLVSKKFLAVPNITLYTVIAERQFQEAKRLIETSKRYGLSCKVYLEVLINGLFLFKEPYLGASQEQGGHYGLVFPISEQKMNVPI